MINLFPTASWVPNPPQALAANTGRLTRRMCGIQHTVVLWSRIYSSHIVKLHSWIIKEKDAGRKINARLPLPLLRGYTQACSFLQQRTLLTCNFASRGPQQGFRTQGFFYRGRSHGHPLLVSTTILHSQKQACAQ